jgi:hypothetical protein
LLLSLIVLILAAGYYLISTGILNLLISDLLLLALFFSFITVITLIIFLRGQSKEPESQTLHSLVSVSLKFLLELVLALVWFIVAKKTSFTSVLLFFVLYLTLTLFSVWVILKTLKNKSL